MNAYKVVKSDVEDLIGYLSKLAIEYRRSPEEKYYEVRDDWDVSSLGSVGRAARLIFLNKTCYNGLYRVNRQGKFNVPWGKSRNQTISEAEKLRAANLALRGASLKCLDYQEAVKLVESGDFVYLDPPYQPTSKTASFTGYTKNQFAMADQVSLASALVDLDRRGIKFLLSNSFSKELESLYRKSGFRIAYVTAPRAISCDPGTRGQTKELLVRNY